MGKQQKILLSFLLIFSMVLGISTPTGAAKKVKLSSKKLSLQVGQTKKLKVKNTKKKVKWSLKKGKSKKYIKLTKVKKTSVTVKAKKKGKAVIIAKVGGKKLTCKVTVTKKKVIKKTAKPSQTPSPKTTPTPSASKSPDASPAPSNPDEPEAVQNVVIDLSNLKTEFTASPATINFSSQLGSRFDLSFFTSLKIGYELTFDGDTALLTGGKVAVADSTETLNGTDDGVAFDYGMMPGSSTVSVPLSGKYGKAVGINIQPMDSGNNFAWPASLTKVKITSIEFIAKKNAVYPKPGEVVATPKPTMAPEFESSEFKYDGLDETWIQNNIDTSKKVVAMSFDDGPGGYSSYVEYGTQIQNALKEAGAHATFFYIGQHIERNADTRKEVENAWKAGFEVANHSYDSSGLNSSSLDPEVIKEKIKKTDDLLKEITGYSHFLFRAPNVAYSDKMFAVIEKPFIDVSIWSNDYNENLTKDDIVTNVTNGLADGKGDGGIINMHSVHQKTAQAVPEILEYCKENGYQVVSVSELFAIKGKKLMTGVKYFNAK